MKTIIVNCCYALAVCLVLAGCTKRLGEGVELKDISVGEAMRVNLGDKSKARAYPVPFDCTNYEFKWESADPSIVTVDNYGTVTTNDIGNTVLYVSQGSIRKEIPVEVYEVTMQEKLAALGAKGYWQFLDAANLFKATIGPDLIPVGSGFAQVDGPNRRAKAVSLPSSQRVDGLWHHNHLLYNHAFGPNGGGIKTNEYTIIVDCILPGDGGPSNVNNVWTNGKYYSLFQTDLENGADASFFWRPGADFGITGNYTTTNHLYVRDTWYRFVVSAKLGQEVSYYLNGTKYTPNSKGDLDGSRAWDPNALLLFADNDGENGQGFPLIVTSLATFDKVLTYDEILSLGSIFIQK